MTPAGVLVGAAAAFAVAAVGARRAPHPYAASLRGGDSSEMHRLADRSATPVVATPAEELPLLLDLLATATAAGMSGALAFEATADALRGTLGRALRSASTAVALGAPLAERIRDIATSFVLPDLARAATLLERSGSLGVPVSVALRELAAEHRRARRRAAELRARTAPVRMLFPLVFLVLPAFLLLTVVPMLLATLGSLS